MVLSHIREDIQAIISKDPAAKSVVEILLCYPGLHALLLHRIAHKAWIHKWFLTGRFLSHIARFLTGIEIHPGAVIGRRVVIDHGMGVVIGETAEVGDDVLIYMGVVLGGTALKNVKRHPTIAKGVVIGSGASVLGPIHVGEYAKIGAGAVVVRDVPPGAPVVGVPGRIAGLEKYTAQDNIRDSAMPDPTLRVLSRLLERQQVLEDRIFRLERENALLKGGAELKISGDRESEILNALRQVIDPEIGHNIVDVDLIRSITISDTLVKIEMKINCDACPLQDYLINQASARVRLIPWVSDVEITVIHDPWDWKISHEKTECSPVMDKTI